MKHNIYRLIAIVLCISSISSCINEPKLKDYSPTIAAPLVNSTLTVYDLLARVDTSDLIVADPQSNLLALAYSNNDLKFKLKDILTVDDFSVGAPVQPNINQPTTVPGGEINFSGSLTLTIGTLPFDIYSIDFSTLNVTTKTLSSFSHEVEIDINLPGLRSGANGFNLNIVTPPNQGNAKVQEWNNSRLNLEAGNDPNKLEVEYQMTIKTNGSPITSNDKIDIEFTFGNLSPTKMEFNPGNVAFDLNQDSIALKIFRNTDNNQVEFELTDPALLINIQNGFQLPFELEFEELVLVENGNRTDVLLQSFPNPFTVTAASSPSQTANTNLEINKNNSNIQQVLTPEEKTIIFDLKARINAQPNERFTITSSDFLDVNLTASLPLQGYVNNWRLSNTIPLSINSDDNSLFKNGGIKYHIESHFPAEAQIQVVFLKQDGTVIDSLFDDVSNQQILKAGVTDAKGKVVSATITDDLIFLSDERLSEFLNADSVQVKARINTANGAQKERIGIYLNDYIKVKLGVKAEIVNQVEQ